jgi:peptidyl-dipeptidase Dcp
MTVLPSDNPFAQPSSLPYQAPPLDRIRDAHIKPALAAGIAEQRREIEAIVANAAAPTFANTLCALENSGQLLARANAVFHSLTASNTNSELEALQTEMAPKMAAHSDWIFLNEKLFARVEKLHASRHALALDAESLRLLERYHTLFVRAGAKLNENGKQTLRSYNEQLSTLAADFLQRVLKGVNASAVIVDSVAELDGLSPEQIAAAGQAAMARGLQGKWLLALINTTGQPWLSQLTHRELRKRIFDASTARGLGGEFDTTHIVTRMVKLRAARAELLGYPHHAAYVLEDETALTADAVNQMLAKLAPAAVANAKREATQLQLTINRLTSQAGQKSFELAPWDWDFYAERLRAEQFAFDADEIRPYFEMKRVLYDGVLFAAEQLYGLRFVERNDLPTYHPTMKVFEIFARDRQTIGLFYVDWYTRENKRGGAWMSSYVDQTKLLGTKAVVINNLNLSVPPGGAPTFMSFDEVITAFHEFGHALHGLLSDVRYPQFSGTNVPRDFVEYPFQYNEMWATSPVVIGNYAKHYQTGEAMPAELMNKVLAARKFNQGFATTEYLAAAIVDQAWHQLAASQIPEASAVAEFEQAALRRAGLAFDPVPPRYRSCYFSHVFASATGYAAGYYAYIWSEVLARATEQWMKDHGGLQLENGERLRNAVLSRGFSVDALTMFRDFYGADPDIGPLLKARGLTIIAG